MSYHSNMTSKGQVTVPKPIRIALGLAPGQKIEFEMDGEGSARILKGDSGKQHADQQAAFRKRVADAQARFRASDQFPGMSTDDYMAMIREPFQSLESGA